MSSLNLGDAVPEGRPHDIRIRLSRVSLARAEPDCLKLLFCRVDVKNTGLLPCAEESRPYSPRLPPGLYKMKTELSSRRPASNTQLSIKQLFNVHDVIFTDEKHQLKRLAFELVTSVLLRMDSCDRNIAFDTSTLVTFFTCKVNTSP